MATISISERRRAASDLEALSRSSLINWDLFTDVVLGRRGLRKEVVARLAELIEPDPERTCRNVGGEDGTNGEYYDFACDACGFCCDLPEPSFCPGCGAKVVEG